MPRPFYNGLGTRHNAANGVVAAKNGIPKNHRILTRQSNQSHSLLGRDVTLKNSSTNRILIIHTPKIHISYPVLSKAVTT